MIKLTATLVPYDGKRKHYGTEIQLVTADGEKVGNSLRVWYCGDSIGGHTPSERDKDCPDIAGGHYESQADLAVATAIVDLINAHGLQITEQPDDESEVYL